MSRKVIAYWHIVVHVSSEQAKQCTRLHCLVPGLSTPGESVLKVLKRAVTPWVNEVLQLSSCCLVAFLIAVTTNTHTKRKSTISLSLVFNLLQS